MISRRSVMMMLEAECDLIDARDSEAASAEKPWTFMASPLESRARKLAVLVEEIGEVAKEIAEDGPDGRIREELIQVAAVAVQWITSGAL